MLSPSLFFAKASPEVFVERVEKWSAVARSTTIKASKENGNNDKLKRRADSVDGKGSGTSEPPAAAEHLHMSGDMMMMMTLLQTHAQCKTSTEQVITMPSDAKPQLFLMRNNGQLLACCCKDDMPSEVLPLVFMAIHRDTSQTDRVFQREMQNQMPKDSIFLSCKHAFVAVC